MRIKCFLYFFLCIIPISILSQSRNWEWKTFTSTREICDMAFVDEQLWCATEGGLLEFKTESNSFSVWTNTEGLASVGVTCVISDHTESLWIGMQDGYLQRFNIQQNQWLTVTDYMDYQIYDMVIHGDSLFVALDIGISVYLISRQEVKETYKHLGEAIEAEIPVHRIIIENNELWAITNQGISHTQLSYSNLLDPQYWENETEVNGLPSEAYTSIIYYQDTFWLGTERGIYFRSGNQSWGLVTETIDIQVVDLNVHQNQLYAITENTLLLFNGSAWQTIASDLPNGLSLTSNRETLFIGTKQGVYSYQDNQFINSYVPDGPAGNFFSALAIDQEGALWCCSSDLRGSSGQGFYKFYNDTWKVFNRNNTPLLNTNLAVCVAVDHDNRKWIGTWGGGVLVLVDDTTMTAYRPENGFLSGTTDQKNYAVIKDIAVDRSGTIWLLNREAFNGLSLVSVTTDGNWTYYGPEDGISNIYLWDIEVDQFNNKWIGSSIIGGQGNGAYYYNDSWTPDDKSDDKYAHFDNGDNLLSKNVQAVVCDEENTVWLGTDMGLNYYAGNQINEKYDLSSVNIQTLLVDGANNLWVGTNKGAYYLSNKTYEWTSYNQSNSDLVHDDVIAMALDPLAGYIYFGTSQGLSRLKTPFSAPKQSFQNLKIYPNPFITKEHEYVSIENLPRDVTVTIFTSQGQSVYQRSPDQVFGNTFIWNGKDASGDDVASGIYLVVVNSKSGKKSIGKLGIIR